MGYLDNYTLDKLKNLTEEGFNKVNSPLKRKRPLYMVYTRVGTKKEEYSEKGQVFHGIYASVWISDWVETSKKEYDDYLKMEEGRAKKVREYGLEDYFNEKGTSKAEVRELRYQNKLWDDVKEATTELETKPSITAYNNLIKVKDFAREVAYQYSTELYELYDKYGAPFLEDKAEYFDRLTSTLGSDVRALKEQREEFKMNKKRTGIEEKIAKLRLEQERLEAELALQLETLGGM